MFWSALPAPAWMVIAMCDAQTRGQEPRLPVQIKRVFVQRIDAFREKLFLSTLLEGIVETLYDLLSVP